MKMKLLTGVVIGGLIGLNSYVHYLVDKKNRELSDEVARLQLENIIIKKELEETQRAVKPFLDVQRQVDKLINDSKTKDFEKKLKLTRR